MTARIQVPAVVKRGDVVEIRIIIQHPMETGYRRDETGNVIPRNTIRSLTCRYHGQEIFRADISSGVAANPYFLFTTVADTTDALEFAWIDDAGHSEISTHDLVVS